MIEIEHAHLAIPRVPGMTRFIDGSFCIFDASPPEEFGQIWLPVCIWCGAGPIEDGLTCERCAGLVGMTIPLASDPWWRPREGSSLPREVVLLIPVLHLDDDDPAVTALDALARRELQENGDDEV